MSKVSTALVVTFTVCMVTTRVALAQDKCPNPCPNPEEAECVNPVGLYGQEIAFYLGELALMNNPPKQSTDFFNTSVYPIGGSRTVTMFSKHAFKNLPTPPSQSAAFFNLTNFPGQRGVLNTPRGILEMALTADGVDPNYVYNILETEEGLDRAFNVLSRIEDNLIFAVRESQLVEFLQDGVATMVMFDDPGIRRVDADPKCDPEVDPVGAFADEYWSMNYQQVNERFEAWRQR